MIWLVFALGLLLGMLVGIVLGDALDLYRSSRRSRNMQPETRSSWTRRLPVFALVITLALNAVVGVLLILTRQSTATYTSCSATWQQQFGEAYKARLNASVAVSEAMDDVVHAVASQDPKAFKKAVAHYVRLREQQDAGRHRNPLPPLPETLCGTPEGVKS